eukprot:gene16330-369_t
MMVEAGDAAAGASCDGVEVELSRASAHVPWGLTLNRKTMRLSSCRKGVSAGSEQARACVGLMLAQVNGAPVRTAAAMLSLTKRATSIRLRFLPPQRPPPGCSAATPPDEAEEGDSQWGEEEEEQEGEWVEVEQYAAQGGGDI